MMNAFPTSFVSGVVAMGYFVLGLFFAKFWRQTRDFFFGIFALAFWLLTANQVAFALGGSAQREGVWIYLLRLCAFVLIIAAIIRKNLRTTGRR